MIAFLGTGPYLRGVKKVLLAFLLGLAAGWGGYWYVDHHPFEAWRAKQRVMNQVEETAHSLEQKVTDITAQVVQEQLARYGVYIVEKARAAGAAVADATTDARITATIKAKLFADPGLSAMRMNVDTSQGIVTLSGSARSAEAIGRAVQLAAGTDGVQRVISTIQIRPEQKE